MILQKIDTKEAPEGFYAVLKSEAKTINVCDSCDALSLCRENKDEWCLKNRCMAYDMVADKDGKTYKRTDGCSVYFIKKITINESKQLTLF